jgi:adenine-specific DNA-methyltransferase
MTQKIESFKYLTYKRPLIPSKEEAGCEEANPKVQEGKKILELPKNPVVHRGQDPELFWLNKYDNDDREDLLRVDIRSLYRHEHIAPEALIKNLYKTTETPNNQLDLFSTNQLFGNAINKDELEKVSEYYQHQDGWTNRLIQGDSHLVMASLLEREGMAAQVQTIYIDPPYGIKYGGNWQIKLNNRDVKDGSDDALSSEPEQIKAFRDTWELGIHSYLSYLRDRLLVAKELLNESGSCFVQISDENVHLVRNIMDEVFGSENFVSEIVYTTQAAKDASNFLSGIYDIVIWYSKNKEKSKNKFRQLFLGKHSGQGIGQYTNVRLPNGDIRKLTNEEKDNFYLLPEGAKIFRISDICSQGASNTDQEFIFEGKSYYPRKGSHWSTNVVGLNNLVKKKRIILNGSFPSFIRYLDDYPVTPISNLWANLGGASDKRYVVQTSLEVVKRCLLMTTDPGDLVLDPTCGSGTTAFVAEQWGRRWITIDTSRIALNIAKQRLMTAVFPYYKLNDEQGGNIRQGFQYKTVPHITLKSLANDEPPATETLYDQPYPDHKKLRVSGPFTVETLQHYEPINPEALDREVVLNEADGAFEETIKQHLLSTGIKNGRKDEMVVFRSVERLATEDLHAEGFYMNELGEQKAYFHIGPKFGTVSKKLVNDAIKACRQKGDANWLVILGFSFESDIEGSTQTSSMGIFEVTKCRIHDDLLQEGLKKKPAKSAASFVTIGDPDLKVQRDEYLVNNKGEIVCHYEIFKKISGLNSLAKINELSRSTLWAYYLFAQKRSVWHRLPNVKRSRLDFDEYCQSAGDKFDWQVSSALGNSETFFSGIADFDYFTECLELSDWNSIRKSIELWGNEEKNAYLFNKPSELKELSTCHYAVVAIKGLDLYDPIKGEVKARNIHEIAYWMVDDDYDGSNFVVRQVFFCGGDKSEFDKWKKGLGNLAKDNTKKKVEKTLKISIDEEAFERLYGHVSHPIALKSKGQKIAVRIISQFGEESTKVLRAD